jgi:hypothetical protein
MRNLEFEGCESLGKGRGPELRKIGRLIVFAFEC